MRELYVCVLWAGKTTIFPHDFAMKYYQLILDMPSQWGKH
jgi:hypothetical protein